MLSSTSVPKLEHPGQRPSQRPVEVPHSEQENWTAAAAFFLATG
jgi:hypothetical protein